MNIVEAARLLGPGKKLVSETGFVAVLDEEGMLVNIDLVDGPSGLEQEPFGFFQEELLSEKWTVIDE